MAVRCRLIGGSFGWSFGGLRSTGILSFSERLKCVRTACQACRRHAPTWRCFPSPFLSEFCAKTKTEVHPFTVAAGLSDQPVREGLHRTAHAGQRFISVVVSEFNKAKNLTREFIFNPGASNEQHLFSPDPGRPLITGIGPADDPVLANTNAAVLKRPPRKA